jgi:hypothetical protein
VPGFSSRLALVVGDGHDFPAAGHAVVTFTCDSCR